MATIPHDNRTCSLQVFVNFHLQWCSDIRGHQLPLPCPVRAMHYCTVATIAVMITVHLHIFVLLSNNKIVTLNCDCLVCDAVLGHRSILHWKFGHRHLYFSSQPVSLLSIRSAESAGTVKRAVHGTQILCSACCAGPHENKIGTFSDS
jgi:hypothetical protein